MKLDYGAKNSPICPKPRRPVSSIPEVLNPLIRCSKHRYPSGPNSNAQNGVLRIVDGMGSSERDEDSSCSGCSQPRYPGSPPGRTGNPLVHDVQFMHQMEVLSPLSRTNLNDKFGYASASRF